jgi:hypothetical protein
LSFIAEHDTLIFFFFFLNRIERPESQSEKISFFPIWEVAFECSILYIENIPILSQTIDDKEGKEQTVDFLPPFPSSSQRSPSGELGTRLTMESAGMNPLTRKIYEAE